MGDIEFGGCVCLCEYIVVGYSATVFLILASLIINVDYTVHKQIILPKEYHHTYKLHGVVTKQPCDKVQILATPRLESRTGPDIADDFTIV